MSKGEKILVFSMSLPVLDIVQKTLEKRLGFKYEHDFFRLDGGTKAETRHQKINRFNQKDDPSKVYLISTKVELNINENSVPT